MKNIFSLKNAAAIMMSALAMTCFTACEDDDDETGNELGTGNIDLNSLSVVANEDGTITISGAVGTDTKLTKFELLDENGEQVVDLLDASDRTHDEDGKKWNATVKGATVPVAIYTLSVRTRFSKTIDKVIGKSYSFEVGTGTANGVPSYVSLIKQKSYTLDQIVEGSGDNGKIIGDGASVEIICNTSTSIKRAKDANSKALQNGAADSKIIKNVVITETGCISTYEITSTGENTATLSGVVIVSDDDIQLTTGF